ncbi:single-stranded DNA-binding protein [Microlunatus sp. Gsoil 973]|uniref:single-stranded DNA-binding protein n=1 Tax=Microlunatus sp. Gsoil 973 TaxID=2672569 RepID=UPI0012B4AA28|nr:single-stranded DNA-binding protein [Microlunatus sp. Gsoil 973]QGN31596.1 single-stranded DNA-binding protein [Microlunatus sp. Gsoil 973]
MAMEALVTITGYVGTAVESRPTQRNTARASFRLACTPRAKQGGNWGDDNTVWMTVICWRTLAEHALASVNKGDPVVVSGKLRNQVWPDADGVVQERLVIEATSVGHDLTRGTSSFRRLQRVDSFDDLDRETGEMIAKLEAEDLADPFTVEDDPASAGVGD